MNMSESAHQENMLSAASAAADAAKQTRELMRQLVAKDRAITDEQIKHMVNRFLMWRLPEPFRPDNGIGFKPPSHPNHPWPVGTNLFDADQAEAMVRHMIEDLP